MPKTVGPIKFNCRQRLRKHRGVERNFDTAAMAAVINSPAVQERVEKGDMLGYYGHYPRVVFGMEPGECGIHPTTGKMVLLDAAICTTKLRAEMDGTITHEVQFLDTEAGKRAAALHGSNKGGFSSAISCRVVNGMSQPQAFHGFDYVFEPNFSGNRGYCLDGVLDAPEGEPVACPGAVFDSAGGVLPVMAPLLAMFDSALADAYGALNRTEAHLARVMAENEELMTLLMKRPEELQRLAEARLAALDSTGYVRPTAPVILARRVTADTSSLGQMRDAFDAATLELREPDAPVVSEATRVVKNAIRTGRAMMVGARGRIGF